MPNAPDSLDEPGLLYVGRRVSTRGTTTQRGYDAKHKSERKRLVPIVARGETLCARCDCLIEPGDPWDLGHTDDRTAWTGAEHSDCNRAAGARKRNGMYAPALLTASREW